MIARRPSNGRSFVTHLLCKGRTIEGRKENISSFTAPGSAYSGFS